MKNGSNPRKLMQNSVKLVIDEIVSKNQLMIMNQNYEITIWRLIIEAKIELRTITFNFKLRPRSKLWIIQIILRVHNYIQFQTSSSVKIVNHSNNFKSSQLYSISNFVLGQKNFVLGQKFVSTYNKLRAFLITYII